MKSTIALLGLACGLATWVPALAAEEARLPGPDARIKAQLDALDYEYDVDEDDDYKMVFKVGDSERSQVVYVRSVVESYGEHHVREIWSFGYVSPTEQFSPALANRLLEASGIAKLGGWVKQGKNAVFVVKLAADASQELLDDALTAALVMADEMEAELTPGQDDL
ncbi:MAG: hypothetical protein EOP91_12780 [Lysobacteraceae bacterium]|nr:MAG: hypothetical protein EOP91_12780 [Xanthomonadaceae bacterium]